MRHIELLRPILLQGLLNKDIPSDSLDFKRWLSDGNYIVRGFPSNKAIQIEVNNEFSFNHMSAYDSCRMACASFETMNNIQSVTSLPKSFGWVAIKSYYAAFFSAHSIMRCFGYLCSQLERGHIRQLNEYGMAVGLTSQVSQESGFFSGVYDSSTKHLSLLKMKNTHEDTWKTLIDCLKFISTKVLSVAGLTTHKQELSAAIDDIIYRLTDKGKLSKGSYLSQFRNAVNYRQEHNAWHPYGKNAIRSEKIIGIMSTWLERDIISPPVWKESKDSYSFFLTCRDLVNLNHQIIELIVDSSENISNIYKRWPKKLLSIAAP